MPRPSNSPHPVNTGSQRSEFDVACVQDAQAVPNQIPSSHQNQEFGFIIDPQFGSEFDLVFDTLEAPPRTGTHQETFIFDQSGSSGTVIARERGSNHPHEWALVDGTPQDNQPVWIPKEIPFVISGVDTPLHQRLFCHFTNTMSNLLTISVGECNPMNKVVIPLALKDRAIMDMVLCLAASHILKLGQGNGDEELGAEKARLHQSVVQMQSHRVQIWESSTTMPLAQPYTIQDKEIIFATSVLLCLYEICKGSGDDSWRVHLDTARRILVDATKGKDRPSVDGDTPTAGPVQERAITEIDPFLIEYFLYHDCLAAVTVPLLPMNKPRLESTAGLADHDPTMVGVQDGLSEFITRISLLRAQTDMNSAKLDGNIISKAVKIWEDLAKWKPKGALSIERKMIAEFYLWALFIWLFSIVYPDGKADPKVQDAVKRIVGGMRNIKFGDGVMSCLLFPLFVIGSAAIEVEDREAISAQFRKLKEWSSLGNIDLTYRVVEKMWLEHDMGLPSSWDWVKQLETHKISLLVT